MRTTRPSKNDRFLNAPERLLCRLSELLLRMLKARLQCRRSTNGGFWETLNDRSQPVAGACVRCDPVDPQPSATFYPLLKSDYFPFIFRWKIAV
jgi:hypothetical protein